MLEFDTMRRWNDWANRTVWQVLEANGGEPDRALAAFQHILEAEITWLRRIVGHPEPSVPLWGDYSLAKCAVWLNESRELVASLSDADLARTFTYRNSQGQSFTDSVALALAQAFTHSSQYRGEAAAILNAAGKRVPDFDLILWVRQRAAESQ